MLAAGLAISIAVSACGSGGGMPGVRQSTVGPAESDSLAKDEQVLRARALTPQSHIAIQLSNGTPTLVFLSLCSGSADGHCQSVDAFPGTAGVDVWHRQFVSVSQLSPADNGFTITAPRYAPNDPLCCPSLTSAHYQYRWHGSRFSLQPNPSGHASS